MPKEIEKNDTSLVIEEDTFQELLEPRLGDHYERATGIFQNYGPNLSFDVTKVLIHASGKGDDKVEKVFERLEKHFEDHLGYQHPEVRGLIRDNLLDINPTKIMFLRILLELEPNQE